MPNQQHKEHLAVLAEKVIDCLKPQAGESYLDLTAGYGGHAELVFERTQNPGNSLLVDRDEDAIKVLQGKFKTSQIVHSDFYSVCQSLASKGAEHDLILADLGVSSPHFDRAERGFAFGQDGPLDMRMDQSQPLTAERVVNTYSQDKLDEIIRDLGEEKAHKVIARAITAARPIHSTKQLAEIIASASSRGWRKSKIHPATKTFQAIRITVNDELGQLEKALPLMCEVLAPGGRLAIISFHSLEDRIVKRYFRDISQEGYDSQFQLVTKHPITPSPHETVSNPRARSAKLRAVAKIKKER